MTTWSRWGSVLFATALVLLGGCADDEATTLALYRAPPLPNTIDGVTFRAGNWEPHLAAGQEGTSWGNHRAVVEVDDPAAATRVTIPWRRRDADPGAKSVVVVDAATGRPVANALVLRLERASGEVVFQPNPGSAVYHVYYMPWHSTGGYYPVVSYSAADYPELTPTPDPRWVAEVSALPRDSLARGRTTAIESVDDFHSFFPMEVAATAEETAAFMDGAAGGWRLIAEHRDRPVRMKHLIPYHWADPARPTVFESRVLLDEAFTFQAVVVTGDRSLSDLRVAFEGFPATWTDAWTCINCEGVDEEGVPFQKTINVPPGTVQPLWMSIRIPDDTPPGQVTGSVTVSTAEGEQQHIAVSLEVAAARAVDGGTDEPDLMTRLAWLNSTAGSDADFIIAPFEPVEIDGTTLSILGREVDLADTGLPAAIGSFFTPDVTALTTRSQPILARPTALVVKVAGDDEIFATEPYPVTRPSRGRAQWTATSRAEHFTMTVEGALEYDGMLDYRITLVAAADVQVDDIALPIHYTEGASTYMLGLGRMGGRRPEALDWRWAVENHQEGAWLGGVDRGLQYVLRDDNYARPLNTNFYRNQPLRMPPSWYNEGRGGIEIREQGDEVVARNYSGARAMAAGDALHFNVRFLVTPFKPIDTRTHFETRFVHQYVPLDSVKAWGGTVVNVHHANEINPYINYPFFNLEAQAAYIDEAHAQGIKVKLYDTIRELTYRAHELFALRSLGDEILNDGEGGGHSWMQEHLEDDYHSAWHAWRVDDAAMLDKGTSRWTNYYIAGLGWLAEHQEIDGLYLDDIAFSRATVKRLVSVMAAERGEVVIDLHSANQFNVRDGFINSAMLYMEHFPYLSRLWFGEYFDYDQGPDYWMTEVAGLPFGLMGEMLQDGGHPYRGLLYGMTARKYGDVDPRPVWAMMNDFGIAEGRMRGYWLDDAPASTGRSDILATTYLRPGRALVALASWSDADEVIRLELDWEALGLDEGADAVVATTPAVAGLQEAGPVDLSAVRVPAGQGLFIVITNPTG